MKPVIESLFHDAATHYLKPDATVEVNQYMSSLKERTRLYRTIRDQEITWMQPIADDLERCFPTEQIDRLENSLRNAMLSLRHCAMAMLMDDLTYLEVHFLTWFQESIEIHDTLDLDSHIHSALRQQLSQALNTSQMRLISPFLYEVESRFKPEAIINDDSLLTVAGLF
jgi:hypothetical protein